MKPNNKLTGVALAMAAAGLVGCASMDNSTSGSAKTAASTDLVNCYGVNQCKGHNDCATADNACGGQANCKGSGFVTMPAKACADIGGKTQDDWTGSTAVADLSHCYGVNVCRGHNDCKTADNACGGQASCKGTGFVAMPAKSCADVGGKVGS